MRSDAGRRRSLSSYDQTQSYRLDEVEQQHTTFAYHPLHIVQGVKLLYRQVNPSIVPPRHAALRQQEEQLHTHSTPLLMRVHRSSASRTCVNIYSQCRCLSDYLNTLEGLEETRIGQAALLLSRSFCIFSLEMHRLL